ncbi:hypothetical protein BGZ60DRAFT_205902 [Tricladium varicosporioides]|nr:hypothetical protein BGZ60DRAFT_205902 [Hymenoscyphus varicosporioides]
MLYKMSKSTNSLPSDMAKSRKSTIFRVTGLPLDKPESEVQSTLAETIRGLFTDDEQQYEVAIACTPTCDGSQTLSALVEFKGGNPKFLSQLEYDPLSDWQVEMGDDDINFDRHFFGFTQLYPTTLGHLVTADIIAITGLDGHAYGSWRGKGNLGRMWLRDFLSKDLPNCRTMIYGYNSKLSSHGINNIMDYGREFLEAIKRVRHTQELRERPLFFIAHSFGGIILAHCLVKAVQTDERDHATIAALHKATYGILFFGTPHKGLVIDDIQRMVAGEDQHPRMELLEQIKQKSDLLIYQLADFRNLIRDRKIVSFYEMQQTRQLEQNPETKAWGRTGEYMTAVETGSALLELPDNTEVKIPVDADHSQIVKFDSRNFETYKMAVGYLKQFEHDAGKVISDQFSLISRKKPPRSTVPFDRDMGFVGREDILTALEHQFCRSNAHNRAVLVGLGGVGKSQIAIEYSYRLRVKDPRVWVFWVYASTAERFEQAYRFIATELDLPGSDDPKTDVLGLVSRWLGDINNSRWLMILDNVDDIDVFRHTRGEGSQNGTQDTAPLSSYIPQTINGSVLLTTRDRKAATWLSTGYTSVISVNLMDPKEAEQLLWIKIPQGISTSSDRAELVKELDYLPLAITQAAAYISAKAVRMSVSKYLTLYRRDEESQTRLLDEESGDLRRDPGVPHSVIRTWQISFDQIKRSKPQAADLLSLIAMFDRQGIPEFLLSVQYPNLLDLEDAIAPLDEFSLITTDKGGKAFEMHRLVQLVTRRWLERYGDSEKWKGEAIKVVAKAFPSGDYGNWKTCEVLLPHSLEVLKCELKSSKYLLERASLLYNMAWYSWLQGNYEVARAESQESLTTRKYLLQGNNTMISDSIGMLALVLSYQGKYDEAEAMHREVLQRREEVLGQKHPDTLTSMNNLAGALDNQGKYDEAEAMHREALQRRKEVLGQKHPSTLTSMNNLAGVLDSQGKYDEAEAMHREELQLSIEVLGQKHPSTLTSMNNLAKVLDNQGKYDEAEAMHREALQLSIEVLGQKHPSTLMSIGNLALILNHQGKYDEAETIHREALQLSIEVLGQKHPLTLTSMNNLALVFNNQGKYDEAEAMHREALQRREEILGRKHPDTLTSMNNLARVLDNQGKCSTETIHREVLQCREEVLGQKHPSTLTSMNNLALLLNNQGKYDEAEAIHRGALQRREEVLGQKHPSTLTSMNNLAGVLNNQGKYDEAEAMHREALQRREEVLGQKHPSTLTSMSNLAVVLDNQGKYDKAEAIHREALQLFIEVLGQKHSDTFMSMSNLALVLNSQGKHDEAEAMHREALWLFIEVLGQKHPDTLTGMNNLAGVLDNQGKYDEAEAIYREALQLSIEILGQKHPSTLTSMSNLAEVLDNQGKYDEAEAMHREALRQFIEVLGQKHPSTLTSMNNLVGVLNSQGKHGEAKILSQQALVGYEAALGPEHP